MRADQRGAVAAQLRVAKDLIEIYLCYSVLSVKHEAKARNRKSLNPKPFGVEI